MSNIGFLILCRYFRGPQSSNSWRPAGMHYNYPRFIHSIWAGLIDIYWLALRRFYFVITSRMALIFADFGWLYLTPYVLRVPMLYLNYIWLVFAILQGPLGLYHYQQHVPRSPSSYADYNHQILARPLLVPPPLAWLCSPNLKDCPVYR